MKYKKLEGDKMSKKDKSMKDLEKNIKKFLKDINKDLDEIFDENGIFGIFKGRGEKKKDKSQEIKPNYRIKE